MKNGKKIFVLSGLLVGFLLVGCNDTYVSSIPDFPVSLELNLTARYPTFRNSVNKSMTFIKGTTPGISDSEYTGYGGILVYTGFDGQYYAFDMSCPYEHKQKILVHPNDIGQAICDSCKTVFDIGYGIGNPSSGKAKETLRRYKANLTGDILYITR
jgi:nitrite reductase/ring-hydroxylating ferredoxin subunit